MKKVVTLALAFLLAVPVSGQNQTASKSLIVTVNAYSVTVAWNAVTTCGQVTCTPSGYNAYRSAKNGGPYTKIGSATALTFEDGSVISGQTWYYTVTAFLPACITGQTSPCGESSFSNQAVAVIPSP